MDSRPPPLQGASAGKPWARASVAAIAVTAAVETAVAAVAAAVAVEAEVEAGACPAARWAPTPPIRRLLAFRAAGS